MTATARIQPGSRADVGLITWVFARISGRVTRTSPPNIFLVLGRHRRLFRGWLHFAGRLMPGGTLPRRESELVILRTAHLRGCEYELEHHRRLGARAGIGPDEIERIALGPDAPGWSDRERLLLRVVDELQATKDLSDATWADVRAELDEQGAIELVLLAAHYDMLATALTVLRVPPDEPRSRRG